MSLNICQKYRRMTNHRFSIVIELILFLKIDAAKRSSRILIVSSHKYVICFPLYWILRRGNVAASVEFTREFIELYNNCQIRWLCYIFVQSRTYFESCAKKKRNFNFFFLRSLGFYAPSRTAAVCDWKASLSTITSGGCEPKHIRKLKVRVSLEFFVHI